MKHFLIDANIYSLALRGEENVISILRNAVVIGISSISVGELLSGFKGGRKEYSNRKDLDDFLDSPRVSLFKADYQTAEYYSEVLKNLKRIGKSIPTNDVWIAATAFQHGLSLLSNNDCFRFVPGLPLINTSMLNKD